MALATQLPRFETGDGLGQEIPTRRHTPPLGGVMGSKQIRRMHEVEPQAPCLDALLG